MGKMNGLVRRVVGFLKRRSVLLVVLMSLFHVALAYIHVRESSGANQPPHLFLRAG